jgi:dTDP-4-dehydrorhamnose 3,5-epimerase
MKISDTVLKLVKVITPEIFKDERGFFFESFNQKKFDKIIGKKIKFVQDNHSKSKKGVIRGLHYQKAPFEQAKLVRVIKGEIFDVAVDIRTSSPDFGKWFGINLSEKNKKQLWIPEGFAHGFQTLTKDAEVIYKTTAYYKKNSEITIKFDDEKLNIKWKKNLMFKISSKDKLGINFNQLKI